jgi:hypothetical protein
MQNGWLGLTERASESVSLYRLWSDVRRDTVKKSKRSGGRAIKAQCPLLQ